MNIQKQLSEFINEDKKAIVSKYDTLYVVDCFIGGNLVSRYSLKTEDDAEVVAEDFIGGTKPTLLNENV